jgi:FeS assembly SUF system protein
LSDEYVRYESGLTADFFNPQETYEAVVKGEKPNSEVVVSKDFIAEKLQNIYDPEIPVDIYNLGLIYDISVNESNEVVVLMTLTSPACPVAEELPFDVGYEVAKVEGVETVGVKITWEVPWNMDMMTEEARLDLNLL